jgi:hypothetical protein
MKKSITMLITVLALCICNDAYCQPKVPYKKAFNYIKGLNGKKSIVVSDTFVSFSLYEFSDELSVYWSKSKNATLLSIDSVELKNDSNKTVEFGFLRTLVSRGLKPTQIIFFSNIIRNNILIAEIMREKHSADLGHDNQSLFNRSTQYLFIFDKNGQIKKVVVHKNIQYN